MFRIKIVIICLGGFLAFKGFQEYQVSKGTTETPVEIELVDIESGAADLTNSHIKLGKHYPVYQELIYYGEENTEKIDYVYYPVLSPKHPFTVKVNELLDKSVDGVDSKDVPPIGDITILIKSERYKNTSELNLEFNEVESIQGLAINKISSLKKDELDLLKQSFPTLDPEKVLIIEEGRTPSGAGTSFAMMGGGSIVCLAGIGWIAGLFGRKQQA